MGKQEQKADHPMQDPDPLLVTATGSWQVLMSTQKSANAPLTWNASTSLGRAVSIRTDDAALKRLQQAVQRAARGRVGSTLVLPPRQSGLGKMVNVRPARESGYAVVTLDDVSTAPPPPPVEIITSLLGITTSEAEIAVQLLQSMSVAEIASARQTSVDTVRGHVKNMLRKTGLSSQKHLTALLARIAVMHSRTARTTQGGEL